MKGFKIEINIDITEVMKIDPSVAMVSLTPDEKIAFRSKLDEWEKGGKKGERPVFEVKYHTAAEMWGLVIRETIRKAYPTMNLQLARRTINLGKSIEETIKKGDGILKISEDMKNFIKSCLAKAEWESDPALLVLVDKVAETVDQATSFVEIDGV